MEEKNMINETDNTVVNTEGTEQGVDSQNKIRKKSLNYIVPIGLVILGVLIIVGSLVIDSISHANAKKIQNLIIEGNNYLLELDYEQAIAAFETAIKIDPKSVDAYVGLSDVYVAMASDEVAGEVTEEEQFDNADGYYEKALDVLEIGYAETNSETIQSKMEEITTLQTNNQANKKKYLEVKEEQLRREEEEKILEESKEEVTETREEDLEETEEPEAEEENETEEIVEAEEPQEEIVPEVNDANEFYNPATGKYIDPDGQEWTKEEVLDMWNTSVLCYNCGNVRSTSTVPITPEEWQSIWYEGEEVIIIGSPEENADGASTWTEGHRHICNNCGVYDKVPLSFMSTDEMHYYVCANRCDEDDFNWAKKGGRWYYMYEWILKLDVL